MAEILKGKPVADAIKEELTSKIEDYKKKGVVAKVAILRVGERPDDLSYEKRVLKNCEAIGMESQVVTLPEDCTQDDYLKAMKSLNDDPFVHGILAFRPLPKQIDAAVAADSIAPEKDIDCMNPVTVSKLFFDDMSGNAPCTPEACIAVLKHYGYDLKGKNVVIVNRSMVLGRPLAMLFLHENATVTICHSRTVDLPSVTRNADIVVTGIGRARFFGPEYFSEKNTVVDVGINAKPEGDGICGDADFEKAEPIVSAITPVPGGIGTITSMILLRHVVEGMERMVR